MLGHIMEWFYAGLAGIDQTDRSAAFREIKIAPQMVGKISEAGATFESSYGLISSQWKKNGTGYDLGVEIPVNTTAVVYLPFEEGKTLTESGKPLSESWMDGKEPGKVVVRVGSGKYLFKQE
jgi:alpha-L-rhamnosidase